MRIVRFLTPAGEALVGRLVDHPAPSGAPGRGDSIAGEPLRARPLVGDLFGAHSFSTAEQPVAALLPPVLPPNIFAIGRNYAEHARETGSKVPEAPLVFGKATTSLLAPGAAIEIPAVAPNEVDYEAELAIVIGRPTRCVSVDDALEYVFGYTCANDVSARDCQRNDKQWTRAKGFDTFCPLGPWIVTRDALDPDRCRIRSRLNGQVMQDSNTSQMIHSCAKLVSYLSHSFTLLPGTVILTGTPEGVGMARTPPVFLKPGDVIEVEIDGIGVLRNTVAVPHPPQRDSRPSGGVV